MPPYIGDQCAPYIGGQCAAHIGDQCIPLLYIGGQNVPVHLFMIHTLVASVFLTLVVRVFLSIGGQCILYSSKLGYICEALDNTEVLYQQGI